MTAELSPVAAAIAAAVDGHRIRKVPLDVVLAAAASIERSRAAAVGWRTVVADAITELDALDLVEVPRTRFDHSAEPALPAYLTRPPRPRPPSPAPPPPIIWHQDLAWVAQLADAGDLNRAERRVLAAVNAWLPRRRGIAVPIRERSLEVFGDEKLLERIMTGPLFAVGRLGFDLLECEACWPPVLQRTFGPGPWVVVENYTTYSSVAERAEGCGFDGRIIWGSGTQVATRLSALAMEGRRPEDDVWYFGDIDVGGFTVAKSAWARCHELGFGDLVPAVPLYELTLQHGARRADREPTARTDVVADWARRWLGPTVGDRAAEVVRAGDRIVQETVGREVLSRIPFGSLLKGPISSRGVSHIAMGSPAVLAGLPDLGVGAEAIVGDVEAGRAER